MDIFEDRIEDYYKDNIILNFEKFIDILNQVREEKIDKKGFEESIKNLNFSSFVNLKYDFNQGFDYQNLVKASSTLIFEIENIYKSYKNNFGFTFSEPLGSFWGGRDTVDIDYSSLGSFFIRPYSENDDLVNNIKFLKKELGVDLTERRKNLKFLPKLDIEITNELKNGRVFSYTFYKTDSSKLIIHTNIHNHNIKHTFSLNRKNYEVKFDINPSEDPSWERDRKHIYRLDFINKKEGMLKNIFIKSADYRMSIESLIEYREILNSNYKPYKKSEINIIFNKDNESVAYFAGEPYKDILTLLPENHILHKLSDKSYKNREVLFEPMMDLYKNNFSISMIPEEIQDIAILYDINPMYTDKYDKLNEDTITLLKKIEELRSNSFYALLKNTNRKKNVI